MVTNHMGAVNVPSDIHKYLIKELQKSAIPCQPVFPWNCFITTKISSEERVYGSSYNLGFNFRRWLRVNSFVSKDEYLGQEVNLTCPRVDNFVDLIKKKGKGCFFYSKEIYQELTDRYLSI